jgi:hypothetical protein
LKNEKSVRKVSSNSFGKKQSVAFAESGNGYATEISVYLHEFTAPMADGEKTFAYLSRGSPFKDMFAVSGYSQGLRLIWRQGRVDRQSLYVRSSNRPWT